MTEIVRYLRSDPGLPCGPGIRRALSLEPGTGAPSWSPLELPALALWISPNGTGTLRGEPSGDPFTGSFAAGYAELTGNGDTDVFVSQADDLSGNDYHAVQATAANQPQLEHDGTRWRFRFDGNQWLTIPVASGLGAALNGHPYTLIAGANLNESLPSGSGRYLFGSEQVSGGSDDFSRIQHGWVNNAQFQIGHWGTDFYVSHEKFNGWHIRTVIYRDPGSTLRRDGTHVDSDASHPSTLDEVGVVHIGRVAQGAHWVGYATEILFCAGHADAELGIADIEAAEAYIDEQGSFGAL